MIGWPFAILLILGFILVVYFYMRGDREREERKLQAVQDQLKRMEQRKRKAKASEQADKTADSQNGQAKDNDKD